MRKSTSPTTSRASGGRHHLIVQRGRLDLEELLPHQRADECVCEGLVEAEPCRASGVVVQVAVDRVHQLVGEEVVRVDDPALVEVLLDGVPADLRERPAGSEVPAPDRAVDGEDLSGGDQVALVGRRNRHCGQRGVGKKRGASIPICLIVLLAQCRKGGRNRECGDSAPDPDSHGQRLGRIRTAGSRPVRYRRSTRCARC